MNTQPPPRGCVLKLLRRVGSNKRRSAAASARLCVETKLWATSWFLPIAAASARLCVETDRAINA